MTLTIKPSTRLLCWTLAAVLLLELVACGSWSDAFAKPAAVKPLSRVTADGIESDVDVRGDGRPVMLIHGGVFGDWYGPLLDETALSTRYRLIGYRRAGSGASARVAGPPKADYWASAIGFRRLLARAGAMSESEAQAWANALVGRSEQSVFFAASNYSYVATRR